MSKMVKGFIQKEYESYFADVDEYLVVSLRGLDGVENNELRGDLLNRQINLRVVKNSLARRAFEQMGRQPTADLFRGPCAITFGGDSIVDVAKVLTEWGKKLEPLTIKGGFLDGKVLDGPAAEALAKLPSRQELQATVVAQALAPGGRIAGALNGPAGRIAGCVKAIAKRLEDAEAA